MRKFSNLVVGLAACVMVSGQAYAKSHHTSSPAEESSTKTAPTPPTCWEISNLSNAIKFTAKHDKPFNLQINICAVFGDKFKPSRPLK